MTNFLKILLGLSIAARSACAQDTATKYIVIDTISWDRAIKDEVKSYWVLEDLEIFEPMAIFDNNYWNERKSPAFCSKVKFMRIDDMAVGVRIDDKGSTIKLHHLEYLADTIRISKLSIVRNCLEDTTFHLKTYFHTPGTPDGIEFYKIERWATYPKRACRDTLQTMPIIINGVKYFTSVTLIKRVGALSGNGFATKHDQRTAFRQWRNKQKKHDRPYYNKFHIELRTNKYDYSAIIDCSLLKAN